MYDLSCNSDLVSYDGAGELSGHCVSEESSYPSDKQKMGGEQHLDKLSVWSRTLTEHWSYQRESGPSYQC